MKWLDGLEIDKDLACDTRVAVPIYVDPAARTTRNWATLGVRLAHSKRPTPRRRWCVRRVGAGPWKEVESPQLGVSRYVLPVDEFAEFDLSGGNVLSREELRAVCDRCQTKEAIVIGLGEKQ